MKNNILFLLLLHTPLVCMNGGSSGFSGYGSGSYYEILKLDSSATEDDIKKAYRRAALEAHPDKNRGREEEFTKKFQELQQAYETLSNTSSRRTYDEQQATQRYYEQFSRISCFSCYDFLMIIHSFFSDYN